MSILVVVVLNSLGELDAWESVSVGGVAQKKYLNYDVDLRNYKIKFGTAPGVGVNNVSVTYYYGDSWVHQAKRREEEVWKAASFPKIIVQKLTESGALMGISDDDYWDTVPFQVDVLAWKDQKCTIDSETKANSFVARYLARRIRETFKDGDHRTHLFPKLEHPLVVANRSVPFNKVENVFRLVVEVQFEGFNVGF